MPPLYDRVTRLTIGSETITQLRLTFEIHTANFPSESSRIGITNLRRETVSALAADQQVRLEAGYVGNSGELFSGRITDINSANPDTLDQETTLLCAAGPLAPKRPPLDLEYDDQSGVTLHQIIQDVVGHMDLAPGVLDAIPDVPFPDGFATTLPPRLALEDLLNPREIVWTERDGMVLFSSADKPFVVSGITVVSPGTGMVASPSATEDGAECRTKLNHRLQVGSQIDLRSQNIKGLFRVSELLHTGDSWGDVFETRLTLKTL